MSLTRAEYGSPWVSEYVRIELLHKTQAAAVDFLRSMHASAVAGLEAQISSRRADINALNTMLAATQPPQDTAKDGASDDKLKRYGYAPGNYMTKCHRCDCVVNGLDKRATCCRACAEVAHAQPPQDTSAKAVQEVIGCFQAAEIEGLSKALAETPDYHLKDLVERRLMYALYACTDWAESQGTSGGQASA